MLQTLLFLLTVVRMKNCEILQLDGTTNFSIKVQDNFTGEAGLCITVYCSLTVPQSVSGPIKRTWFKGDPQNPTVEVPCMTRNMPEERDCSFMLNNLVKGIYDGEYRFKLEWGQGKVHIFPQTVRITVKELTQKPTINVPQLSVGEKAEISCKVPGDCINPSVDIVWTGIEPDEIKRVASGVPGRENHFSVMTFHPEPEHHHTKLTCTAIFRKTIQTESTVILEVRHAPKILNSSRCLVWGDELTCICVSSGLPLPQIYWPILDGITKYYSTASAENTISISNISIPGFRNINTTVECVSKNLIGMTKMQIQVHSHAEKPKVSWSLSTPWIFFTLSAVVNVIFASCLTVVLRREKLKKPKDDNHVYMTSMAREESMYETIKMSSERS